MVQVSSFPFLGLHLVRPSMGDSVGSSVSAEGNKIQYSGLSLPVPLLFSCVEEGLEESHGKITICFNSRSHLQATSYRSQSVPVKSYQSQAPGQKVSSITSPQEIFMKVFSSLSIEEKRPLEKICTFHRRTHRCLNVGMGLPYILQTECQARVFGLLSFRDPTSISSSWQQSTL